MSEILEHSHLNKNNKSHDNFKFKENISIEDINYTTKKVRITSPRSLKAMKKLGINNKDLEYLTFKEFKNKNPEILAETKRIQKFKYDYCEEIRKRLIDQIRETKQKIIEEGEQKTKRSTSSKYRKSMALDNMLINSNKFTEKDLKSFKRMRNINKTNLFNRLEIELNKELKNLINQEQIQKENAKTYKNSRRLERKLKKENEQKIKKEEEKIRKDKEIDKMKRKEEEQRIMQLIQEEIDEEERKKEYQREESKHKKQELEKRAEFQKNLQKLRDFKHKSVVEKNQQKQLRVLKNLMIEAEKRREKRLESEHDYKERIKIVNDNKKKIKEDNELKNKLLLIRQKSQQEKRAKEEERRNKEMKIYQKKVISQLSKNNDDIQMLIRQKNLSEMEIMELLSKTPFFNEKEKKQKETLLKNEILMNKRKEDIMNKIFKKERSIDQAQYEKDYANLIERERKIQNVLDRENRVKLIGQYLENKREELRELLEEKDKRVEKFNKNKTNMIHLKRLKYDEILKEKNLDNDKIEKIMNKKSLDKKSLNSFIEMFPDNDKMYRIVNEFNAHIRNKNNYRYTFDGQY